MIPLKDLFLKFVSPEAYERGIELINEVKKDNPDAQKVKALLDKGAPLRLTDPEGGADAPVLAVMNGHADILKMMIDKGIDLDYRYATVSIMFFGITDSKTMLDWALGSFERHPCAKLLIESGADINKKRMNNYTFLMEAAYKSYKPSALELAHMMIERGANLKTQDDTGRTALHEAAWMCTPGPSLVEAMLDREPSLVNIADNKGWTPLMRILAHSSQAVDEFEQGWAKVAEILIKRGADLTLRDKEGKTALDLAKANPRLPAVVAMIETALGSKSKPNAPKGPGL